MLYQLVKNPSVSHAKKDKDRSTDACSDDISNALEAIEPIPQSPTRSSDHNAGDEDDSAVPKREERANSSRTLAGSDEPARHEINGGDVIRIEGVTQAESVRERRGGNETRVKVKNYRGDGPYDCVGSDEDRDHSDTVVGDAAEEIGLRGKLELAISCHGCVYYRLVSDTENNKRN